MINAAVKTQQRVEASSAHTHLPPYLQIASGQGGFLLRGVVAMPWDVDLAEDRRFKKFILHGLGICLLFCLLVFLLPKQAIPPVITQENKQEFARLIIEEKIIPKVPDRVEPVIEKKKEPKIAAPKTEKPKPAITKPKPTITKPKPKLNKPVVNQAELKAQAREKAANAGLLAMSDQLSSLRQTTRQSANRVNIDKLKTGQVTASRREVLTVTSVNNNLSGGAGITQQDQEKITSLEDRAYQQIAVSASSVEAISQDFSAQSEGGDLQKRSADEVRRVMDANKGAIYAVYNRVLRKDPNIEGAFSFRMVIEPSGKIATVELVSSELNNASLEKRLLSRIRMIKFEAADVSQTQVNYSFDFLPY